MNKKLLTVLVSGAAAFVLAGCPSTPAATTVAVESVELNHQRIYIAEGEVDNKDLKATVKPAEATNKAVIWTSDSDCVTVNERGYLTGVSLGESIVTVTTIDGGKKASCVVSVLPDTDPAIIYTVSAPVERKASYVQYLSNIAQDSSSREGYFDKTQGYAVGCDNPVNLKPVMNLYDRDLNPVSQDFWTYDYLFEVSVKNAEENYVEADESLYEVVDAKECNIKFADEAVGKTFKVSVTPGHLPEEDEHNPNFTASYEFNVVEGYNAYTAKELGYLDNRHGTIDQFDEGDWHPNETGVGEGYENSPHHIMRAWDSFKTANGLNPNYDPKAVILHNDIEITNADFPENFRYLSDVPESDLGSLKDTAHIYSHITNTPLTLNGNYFHLKFEKVARVTRDEGKASAIENVNSHTALLRAINGQVTVKNINLSGNAKKAGQDEADNVNAGGLIFYKAGDDATVASIYNTIARQCYITMMSDSMNDEIRFTVDKFKGYDNYNSFFYNWGGLIHVKDSVLENVGGPIVIQDHSGVGNDKNYEDQLFNILGHSSTTVFENCSLKNYVAGDEAWFKKFGAQDYAETLKASSDLLTQIAGKTFLFDEHGNPTYSASGVYTFFNFISFNKTGRVAGLSNDPVCGTVKIIHDSKEEIFDYFQPNSEEQQAYAIAAEIQLTLESGDQAAIAALCQKYQVAGYEQLIALAQEKAAICAKSVTYHQAVRSAGASVPPTVAWQSGHEFAFVDKDYGVKRPDWQAADPRTADYISLAATDPFFTEMGQYLGVYFMNMQLVVEAATLQIGQ